MRLTRSARASLAALSLVASLIVAVLAAGAATTSASAATCSTTPTGGTVTKTIWMGWSHGIRSYNLRVPAGITGDAPLLVDLHGLGSNAFFQEVSTGWSQYADQEKFIVAYPAGSYWGQAWNVNQGSVDVAFIRAMVNQIAGKYCVDDNRVFAEGGSLGGFMSQRLACDAEDVFASVVSTISSTFDFFGGTCALSRPVSVGIVNAESDPLFPPAQGAAARDLWLEADGCSTVGTPDPNAYGAAGTLYSDCDGTAEVLWRTYPANGHAYPTGAALGDFHDRIWSFLMANPKP